MKKLSLLFVAVIGITCFSGCEKKPKADMMMHCTYSVPDTDTGVYTSNADFTYVSETNELVSGNITHNYKDYPKDQYNNKVLTDITIRKTKFDELKGVKMDIYRTETEFGSKENWDYPTIDLEAAIQLDEEQNKFIDTDAGYYSLDKTKDYYESHNYACSISDIKE